MLEAALAVNLHLGILNSKIKVTVTKSTVFVLLILIVSQNVQSRKKLKKLLKNISTYWSNKNW